jgi:beta-1,4-mannooligosaccharide/beta-1,4-mannosyl-N-acetylglucosamine phosphorylase
MDWVPQVKIGSGAAPMEAGEDRLLFLPGVPSASDGSVSSFGAVILDTEEHSKVKYRCEMFCLRL